MATIELPPTHLVRAVLPPWREVPSEDADALETYLSDPRKQCLKEKYGWGSGLPKIPRGSVPDGQLARADALRKIGFEKRADRAEICGLVGELYECRDCGGVFKRSWGCCLRSCPLCAKKIFDAAFAELLPLESYIPSALASLPGYGWKILDFTFWHDGDFPSRDQMRKMRQVINRVLDRALREQCHEMYRAGLGCRIRYDEDGQPVTVDGWPYVSAPDGSARILRGWTLFKVGRVQRRPACCSCGSRVRRATVYGPLNAVREKPCRLRGSQLSFEDWVSWKKRRAKCVIQDGDYVLEAHAERRLCPKCGVVEWPEWDNVEVDTRHWALRFGFLQVVVSEFGYNKETGSPNTNYHFHTCYFGPYLDQARLVEIFREESLKALGVESRGVYIAQATRGYRSALAHALKYTAKPPATTPEGLAQYEKVLVGVRRYAVRGFLQGVSLEVERSGPRCLRCKNPLKRVGGLGLVPLSEIADIPFLLEDKPEFENPWNGDDFSPLELEEVAIQAARAP